MVMMKMFYTERCECGRLKQVNKPCKSRPAKQIGKAAAAVMPVPR
jgi:hypothetical protein